MALLDDVEKFAFTTFKNILLDRGCSEQDLKSRNPRRGIGVKRLEQLLVNNGTDIESQQLSDLGNFTLFEEVIDTTEGLPCGRGVDGPEHNMAGFGRSNSGLECLFVPHLAHEDNIGIFSNERPQCLIEIQAVDTDFALIDRRLDFGEDVLDRVFDRHDVAPSSFIDVLEHGGDGCTLAAARDPCEENQTVGCECDITEKVWHMEIFEPLDFRCDQPAGVRHLSPAHEDIHTKSMVIVVVVGDVHLTVGGEDLVLVLIQYIFGYLMRLVVRDMGSVEGPEFASNSYPRRSICLDVQIGGRVRNARLEKLTELRLTSAWCRAFGVMDEPGVRKRVGHDDYSLETALAWGALMGIWKPRSYHRTQLRAGDLDTQGPVPDHPQMERISIPEGITFDDVLLVPQRSHLTPDRADVSTRLTRRITLQLPLISAPMDTVTESQLAISLAQEGGIGIIHKNLSPEIQAAEVARVKRSQNGIITDPVTLNPDDLVQRAIDLMESHYVSGFPVTSDGSGRGRVAGILTRRDINFVESTMDRVGDVMTGRDRLVTAAADVDLADAESLMSRGRIEKLILVDQNDCLAGLVTMRDIENVRRHPHACRDSRGRLRVGAAVGVHQMDRVESLIAADVDVLIVDTAHGHSENVLQSVRDIKAAHDIDVIAGNIATGEAAEDLIDAGADAVKVGIGPGSICTTRIVSGVGVPQLTAIANACVACRASGVPVIADGGIRQSGDIPKAIGFGANAVMLGSLFAGLDESPGELVLHGGRRYKTYRGMGSIGAMGRGSADRYGQAGVTESTKLVPEGVEGRVPYRGSLSDFVHQMIGGLRAAMGYCGCENLEALQQRARFVRVSGASLVESHAHDIQITKEAPNYTTLPRGNE